MSTPITTYATIAQLESLGMRAEALAKIQAPQKTAALETASRVIDGYLARFTLPLMAIGTDLSRACAIVASYDLLSAKGFNPDANSSDENVRRRYEDTLGWLKLVAMGRVVPAGILDSNSSTPGLPSIGRARVISSSTRGYSVRGTGDDPGPFQGQ